MRKKIAAGNWKMNTSLEQGLQLSRTIINDLRLDGQEVIFGVPATHLKTVLDQTLHIEGVHIAAQNCHQALSGAFTGEISASMLSSMGIPYVILGHSERRQHNHESNALLKEKLDTALGQELKVIFCCGEPLEIRKANNHIEYVSNQLKESLFHLSELQMAAVVIAYEPIWAIGTGETASPEQAQEMHENIRALLAAHFSAAVAESCSILYGGSVKPANAQQLFSQKDIDGGLVGGASLKADSFLEIINSF